MGDSSNEAADDTQHDLSGMSSGENSDSSSNDMQMDASSSGAAGGLQNNLFGMSGNSMRTTGDNLAGGGGSDNDRIQFDGSSSGAADDMQYNLFGMNDDSMATGGGGGDDSGSSNDRMQIDGSSSSAAGIGDLGLVASEKEEHVRSSRRASRTRTTCRRRQARCTLR